MKHFSNILIVSTVFFFLASCKKENVFIPSVVGIWSSFATGIKTESKIIEVTITDLKKYDNSIGTIFENSSIEFKEDGTYIINQNGISENGIYTIDPNFKKIITASSQNRIFTYEILSLARSEMLLGFFKSSKKDDKGNFIFNEGERPAAINNAENIFRIKGLDPKAELSSATEIQATIKMKK